MIKWPWNKWNNLISRCVLNLRWRKDLNITYVCKRRKLHCKTADLRYFLPRNFSTVFKVYTSLHYKLPFFIPDEFWIRKNRHFYCLFNKQTHYSTETHLITQLKISSEMSLGIPWQEVNTENYFPHLVKPLPEYTEW